MKKLYIYLFLFTFFSSKAQSDFTKIYHPIINEAELAIVDDNHDLALSLYKEAFVLVEKPFAKDYYNAAICAVFTNRMSLAFDYLEKIVEKGYPADSLRKDKFFKAIADTSKRWNTFEKQAKLIKPQINIIYGDSLKKILEESFKEFNVKIPNELRAFYKKENPKSINADSLMVMISMPDSIQKMVYITSQMKNLKNTTWNYQLLQKTLKMLDIYGFPDENLIGLTNFETRKVIQKGLLTTSFKPSATLSSSLFLDIISNNSFLEFRDTSAIKNEINQHIFEAVRNGKLLPRDARTLLNVEANFENRIYHLDNVSVFQIRLDNNLACESNLWKEKSENWFWRKTTSPFHTLSEVNEKRRNLGLENLEDAYRKTFFKAVNPKTPFYWQCGGYSREIFYVSSCESAEKAINESEILK